MLAAFSGDKEGVGNYKPYNVCMRMSNKKQNTVSFMFKVAICDLEHMDTMFGK